MIANNIVTDVSDTAKVFVDEAFDLLLAGLDMEDEGFEMLDDLLGY
jgi:hypothetical protein